MRSLHFLLLLTTVLLLCFPVANAILNPTSFKHGDGDTILSPLGMRISRSHVHRYISQPEHQVNLHEHIYELDPSEFILHSHTNTPKKLFSSSSSSQHHIIDTFSSPNILLNGNPVSLPSRPSLKIGSEFTVVLSSQDVPLAIRSPNHNLVPLDVVRYPNVFVNVGSGLLKHSSMKEDIVYYDDDINTPDSDPRDERRGSPGTSEDGSAASSANTLPCSNPTAAVKEVEIALVADSMLCNQYGSANNLRDAVEAMVTESNTYYRNNTCLSLNVKYWDIRCDSSTDPYLQYMSYTGVDVLTNFSSDFAPASGIHRDTVVYLSGYNDGSNTLGVAYLGRTCSRYAGYAWVEFVDVPVFVHELSHNLNGDHTTEGIMRPFLVRNDPIWFSDASNDDMNTFADSSSFYASCLQNPSTSPTVSASASPPPPPPSPSTVPQGPSTCGELYSTSLAPKCVGKSVGTIDYDIISGTDLTSVSATIQTWQQNGIRLNIRAPPRFTSGSGSSFEKRTYKLLSVSASASITSSTGPGEGFVSKTLSTPRGATTIYVDFSQVSTSAGTMSCCDQDMKVFINVQLQEKKLKRIETPRRTTNIVEATTELPWTMACNSWSCGSSRTFVPMSSSRRCSGCVRN